MKMTAMSPGFTILVLLAVVVIQEAPGGILSAYEQTPSIPRQ